MPQTELETRWNREASRFCAGSEFIDEPERVFERIRQQLKLAKEVGKRLGRMEGSTGKLIENANTTT